MNFGVKECPGPVAQIGRKSMQSHRSPADYCGPAVQQRIQLQCWELYTYEAFSPVVQIARYCTIPLDHFACSFHLHILHPGVDLHSAVIGLSVALGVALFFAGAIVIAMLLYLCARKYTYCNVTRTVMKLSDSKVHVCVMYIYTY